MCNSCAAVVEANRRRTLNVAMRTAANGACRVKHVQSRYGHAHEIPIEAYREAGVAWKRSDYVTEQDVAAASNAWDARSIAHDIDTQWGSMPGGGAYSDSNSYYGSGAYDYW